MLTGTTQTRGTYTPLRSELQYGSLLRDSAKPEQVVNKLSLVLVLSAEDFE